ncbi:MAG: hypothetical protein SFT81_06385 [Candidatus Caenarcaniphilales bacterium]|nr:hypothetical protein [Candidatus Caenarcaniphilales bacterium]
MPILLAFLMLLIFTQSAQAFVDNNDPIDSSNIERPVELISRDQFIEITVDVSCFRKSHPDATPEETSYALYQRIQKAGYAELDPRSAAELFILTGTTYIDNASQIEQDKIYAEIGQRAIARGCELKE